MESISITSHVERMVGDVPSDTRQVLVRVHRLMCPTLGFRQTFREQLLGVRFETGRRRMPGPIPKVDL
jgi:hypothetical protein